MVKIANKKLVGPSKH